MLKMLRDSSLSSEDGQVKPVLLLVACPCAIGVTEPLCPRGSCVLDPGLVTALQGLAAVIGSGMAHNGKTWGNSPGACVGVFG